MGGKGLHSSESKERLFIVYDDGTNKIKPQKWILKKIITWLEVACPPLLELIHFTSL